MLDDPAERQACQACPRPGLDWHGTGVWLIVHGADRESVEMVSVITSQCHMHGVTPWPLGVDDVPLERMHVFHAVVFVLPPAAQITEVTRSLVARYKDLLRRYRTKRQDGLAEAPRLEWFFRGMVMWIGPKILLDNPLLDTALQASDAKFEAEAESINLFDPFSSNSLLAVRPTTVGPQSDAANDRGLAKLSEWGAHRHDLVGIKQIIDIWRDNFDSATYSKVSGPYGVGKNRFEIVLDGPGDTVMKTKIPAAQWNEFVAEGARVVKRVIAEIKNEYPGFARPAGDPKYIQRDFKNFYRILRIAIIQLREDSA